MNKICAKIYYLVSTGEILFITSECQGCVSTTTKEQDMNIYQQLQGYTVSEINYIELTYGTLTSIFKNVKSYKVNPTTKKLEITYYTQDELDIMQKEQETEQTILDRISTISEYANLDNNLIDTLENAIIEYETTLITSGVN